MAFLGPPRRRRQDESQEELHLCVYGVPATIIPFNAARDVEPENLLGKWQFDEFSTIGACFQGRALSPALAGQPIDFRSFRTPLLI